MRMSKYSESKEASIPSTSLIAIIARCTAIQFADCSQFHPPKKMKLKIKIQNPRNEFYNNHRRKLKLQKRKKKVR